MYYEAKTLLTSHPDLCYDDGRTNYFFYGKGRNNLPAEKFNSTTVAELMRYIVTGEKAGEVQSAVEELDSIISAVKKRREVTKRYMKEWDRQRLHDIELTKQVRENDVFDFIQMMRENEIPDERIRSSIESRWNYSKEKLDEIFRKVDAVV